MTKLINTLPNHNILIKNFFNIFFDDVGGLIFEGHYEIICALNGRARKDTIIACISNLDKDLKFNQTKAPKDKVARELLKKNLPFINEDGDYYDLVVSRAKRVMVLYCLNASKTNTSDELESEIGCLINAILLNGCCDVLEMKEIRYPELEI